ncbi:RDD family protein [Nesterenkonia sp. HG001]|uniref:RDD family protein n=1 Tax=Nesterenkonia sp. HG001 TaxID=2983207 RepID=UPI002AC6226E|nr:RDD family protein [Nesterenkonia sp. HG001]MDZ5078344.1 RDD family protein [Nesterenkonia sp. HG001]
MAASRDPRPGRSEEPEGGTGDRWPGDRLGLPERGPGSLAPFGRRVLALLIDWGIALLISTMWFDADPIVTLLLFAAMHIILIGLLGVTIGKRLVRIQVVRDARAPGPLWATVRTLLLLVVIPAIVFGPDGRAGHDRVAGTMQLRM